MKWSDKRKVKNAPVVIQLLVHKFCVQHNRGTLPLSVMANTIVRTKLCISLRGEAKKKNCLLLPVDLWMVSKQGGLYGFN
jgi:hypothetical protein